MRRRRVFVIPLLVALFSGGLAGADGDRGNERHNANGTASFPPDPARVELLLKQWEIQSARLKTLEFSIYRIDRDQDSKERHYEGHVAFKGPKQAYRDLKKIKLVPDDNKKMVPLLDTSKKRVSTPLDTIIWSGEELWHYRYDTKHLTIFRLDKDLGPQRPPRAPLPLVFNVKAAEARRRYNMELLDENPDQYLLKITPKTREDQSFGAAWIVLDARSLLPRRILLLLPDKKTSQDVTLSQFQANEPVDESFFRVAVPGKPWRVERFPGSRAHAGANGTAARLPANGQTARPVVSDAAPPR